MHIRADPLVVLPVVLGLIILVSPRSPPICPHYSETDTRKPLLAASTREDSDP